MLPHPDGSATSLAPPGTLPGTPRELPALPDSPQPGGQRKHGPSPEQACTEPRGGSSTTAGPSRPRLAHRGQHSEVLPGQVPQHHHVQLPHGRGGRGAGTGTRGKGAGRSAQGPGAGRGGRGRAQAAHAQQRPGQVLAAVYERRSAGSRCALPVTEPRTATETQRNCARSSA